MGEVAEGGYVCDGVDGLTGRLVSGPLSPGSCPYVKNHPLCREFSRTETGSQIICNGVKQGLELKTFGSTERHFRHILEHVENEEIGKLMREGDEIVKIGRISKNEFEASDMMSELRQLFASCGSDTTHNGRHLNYFHDLELASDLSSSDVKNLFTENTQTDEIICMIISRYYQDEPYYYLFEFSLSESGIVIQAITIEDLSARFRKYLYVDRCDIINMSYPAAGPFVTEVTQYQATTISGEQQTVRPNKSSNSVEGSKTNTWNQFRWWAHIGWNYDSVIALCRTNKHKQKTYVAIVEEKGKYWVDTDYVHDGVLDNPPPEILFRVTDAVKGPCRSIKYTDKYLSARGDQFTVTSHKDISMVPDEDKLCRFSDK